MKKFTLLLVVMFVSIQFMEAITIQFQKPDHWNSVYVYGWGGENEADPLGAWPGVEMTAQQNGWYSYTVDDALLPLNLIFNNNDNEQTVNAYVTVDACFETTGAINGDGHLEVAVVPCTPGGITVQFQKPDTWTSVYLHAYSDAGNHTGGWPGTQLSEENGWYSYSFDGSLTGVNVIYNNGDGEQTSDLYVDADACFMVGDGLTLEVTACGEATALAKNGMNDFGVYPNPLINEMFIQSSVNVEKVMIFSMSGVCEMVILNPDNNSSIDVSDLIPGLYFVKTVFDNNQQTTISIVKQK